MNKKFLSAILFGALMVTSTGTFVSCKDYDDEIDNLQTQIDANKTAISELKNLVGDGNYVTSVTVSGQNLVVNTKNGSTTVALPACEGGTQAEVKDNELFIDGEATGIKVAAGEAVKVVEGEWAIQQADGSYKSTNIPASGVTVTGDEKDGYILTIVDAEGEETVIELPTAASAITSLSLANGADNQNFNLSWFNFDPSDTDKAKWKAATGKEVGADSKIYFTSAAGLGLRVNPVTVDAKEIDFTLVNGKNETFPLIVLNAKEDQAYATTTRAAYGNGLYTLDVKTFSVIADDTKEPAKTFKAYFDNAATNGNYAVAANSAVRAEYNVKVTRDASATTATIGCYKINDVAVTATGTPHAAHSATVKAGVEQTVTVVNPDHLYDLYLNASSEDINIFGITFSEDHKSFTITKSPDQVTAADFDLTVYTMDNSGAYKEATITITLSEAIDAAATYETRTLAIVANKADKSDANFFKADMATMKTALGGNLDIWKRKVSQHTVTYYTDAACEEPVEFSAGTDADDCIELSFINADGVATYTTATDMKFYVINDEASAEFDVNTVYYAKVSFSNGTEVLNSVVIPFQFTVPTFASLFEVEPAVFTDGVAYAYLNVADQLNGAANSGVAAYAFANAFKTIPTDAKFTLADDDDIIADEYNSDDLAKIGSTAGSASTTNVAYAADLKIYLNNVDVDATTGLQAGYGKELLITATDANGYEGWDYAEGEDEFVFKMKVMSPIYEGTITSIKSSVEVPVTSVEGYKMGNNDIEGKTYGAVAYKVFQDVATGWSRPEIAKVTGASENERVAKIGNAGVAAGVTTDTNGKVTAEGYLQILPQNIENTTDVVVNLTVEDIWGYKKVSPITVTVKK